MSKQELKTFECSQCRKPVEIEIFQSLNPERQKEINGLILRDQLQLGTCTCGQQIRIEPDFVYMDISNRYCVMAKPSKDLNNFKKLALQAETTFKNMLAISNMDGGLRSRVSFGWPALKEKVLAHTHGISDVHIEMVKLAIIKQLAALPDPKISFRLVEITDQTLTFASYQNESPYAEMSAYQSDRSVLQSMTDYPEDWADVQSQIDRGAFIDLFAMYFPD